MIDKNLEVRIKLEAFITERDGMLIENADRLQNDKTPAYCNDAFYRLSQEIRALISELN